jgi:hypothetical protein
MRICAPLNPTLGKEAMEMKIIIECKNCGKMEITDPIEVNKYQTNYYGWCLKCNGFDIQKVIECDIPPSGCCIYSQCDLKFVCELWQDIYY